MIEKVKSSNVPATSPFLNGTVANPDIFFCKSSKEKIKVFLNKKLLFEIKKYDSPSNVSHNLTRDIRKHIQISDNGLKKLVIERKCIIWFLEDFSFREITRTIDSYSWFFRSYIEDEKKL